MEKPIIESKTLQGIALAVLGALWGVWASESEVSLTIITLGLGWAGFGLRSKLADL